MKITKLLFNPVVLLLLMSTGILSFIELMHISYHNKIDHDIHGHVREFCRNNPDVCQFKD